MADEKLPLILHPGSGLVQIGPQGGRILAEMVDGVLALSLAAKSSGAFVRRFRVGEHELREPDYQQILLWAKALELEPETVLERLMNPLEVLFLGEDPESDRIGKLYSEFVDGRIVSLIWDIALLPLHQFEWIEGLGIEGIRFHGEFNKEAIWRLSLPLPKLSKLDCECINFCGIELSFAPLLTSLCCGGSQLTELDLSAVPRLESLYCSRSQLTQLDLSPVPRLESLSCRDNQFTKLDLSTVARLRSLDCGYNQLTSLDLSAVPRLKSLYCLGNHLTSVDLSAVPRLEFLNCSSNQLIELDIRSLRNLTYLKYDKAKTRLIQRPDQNF